MTDEPADKTSTSSTEQAPKPDDKKLKTALDMTPEEYADSRFALTGRRSSFSFLGLAQ